MNYSSLVHNIFNICNRYKYNIVLIVHDGAMNDILPFALYNPYYEISLVHGRQISVRIS